MEALRFEDITPIEIEVTIGKNKYLLRETSGAAAIQYENARAACYEYKEGKLARVNNLANTEHLLVSLCLFNEDGTNVSQETIGAWPDRIVKPIYQKVREISGMNETLDSLKKQLEVLKKQIKDAEQKEELAKN